MTGVLSSSSRKVIQRNAAFLPAYSFMLGLLALTGFMALAIGVDKLPEFAPQFAQYKSNFAVPALILHAFPIGLRASPSLPSGSAAWCRRRSCRSLPDLFTRNIYMHFIRPDCTPKQEARNAKIVSLVIKFGALVFIIFLPLNMRSNSNCSARNLDQSNHTICHCRTLHALVQSVGAHNWVGGGSYDGTYWMVASLSSNPRFFR